MTPNMFSMVLQFYKYILFLFYVCECFVCIYVCFPLVCSIRGGQEGALAPLELELKTVGPMN